MDTGRYYRDKDSRVARSVMFYTFDRVPDGLAAGRKPRIMRKRGLPDLYVYTVRWPKVDAFYDGLKAADMRFLMV